MTGQAMRIAEGDRGKGRLHRKAGQLPRRRATLSIPPRLGPMYRTVSVPPAGAHTVRRVPGAGSGAGTGRDGAAIFLRCIVEGKRAGTAQRE